MTRIIHKIEAKNLSLTKRSRVAAYCRVSSGKDAMIHSLAAQVSHYSQSIQANPLWEYAGVYVDEAVTGTKDSRPEFQRLLSDCRAGKVDIILTKSISRFTRNTLTLLQTVRELKALSVEVWFEQEHIKTFSGDGEMMLSLLGSCFQEESKQVSDNCKWRIRKNFSEGMPPYVVMLGYRLQDNRYVIIPEEAEVVKMIYQDFFSGLGRNLIVKKLNALGKSPIRNGRWSESGITQILTNEKYTGSMVLQKTFVSDHISKKKRPNQGELQKYLAEFTHEAIIEKDTFDKVQEEIKRRAEIYYSKGAVSHHPYAGKITCAYCGKKYVRKKRKKRDGGTRHIWICPTFSRFGKEYCKSTLIAEEELEAIFPDGFHKATALSDHRLEITHYDGRCETIHYSQRTRKKGWTDEMKEEARRREKTWQEK